MGARTPCPFRGLARSICGDGRRKIGFVLRHPECWWFPYQKNAAGPVQKGYPLALQEPGKEIGIPLVLATSVGFVGGSPSARCPLLRDGGEVCATMGMSFGGGFKGSQKDYQHTQTGALQNLWSPLGSPLFSNPNRGAELKWASRAPGPYDETYP